MTNYVTKNAARKMEEHADEKIHPKVERNVRSYNSGSFPSEFPYYCLL